MPENCESVMKKELDEQFDDDAVIPSSTIFSYAAPPEGMGFFAPRYKKRENREQRKKEVQQEIEEVTPNPQEVRKKMKRKIRTLNVNYN